MNIDLEDIISQQKDEKIENDIAVIQCRFDGFITDGHTGNEFPTNMRVYVYPKDKDTTISFFCGRKFLSKISTRAYSFFFMNDIHLLI